jgi:site-specific DNA recombinase
MKRAAAYVRVSTDKQAEKYGPAYQEAAIGEWAEANGYRIVEVVSDLGYGRDELHRPGFDKLRNLAENGQVDAVIAWKRDRYGEQAVLVVLRLELETHGVRLLATDDTGGDTAETALMDAVKDGISGYERRKTKERTIRGTRAKLDAGKLIIGRRVNYGFKANEARNGYLAHEPAAKVVRRIFDLVGNQGKTLSAVGNLLNEQAIPSPAGGKWNTKTIRTMILDDIYKPHTAAELVALGVKGPEGSGVKYYGRRRVKNFVDPETYAKRTAMTHTDPETWIGVAIPNLGVPRAAVDVARAAIEGRVRSSNAGRRVWELDRGMLRYGCCGWAMVPRTTPYKGKPRFYYVCSSYSKKAERCAAVRHYRAEPLEQTVATMLSDWFKDVGRVEAYVNERIEAERRRLFSGDPDEQAKALAGRLAKLGTKLERNKEMYAEGVIDTMDELKARQADLREQQQAIEAELDKLQNRKQYLEQLERDKKIVLALYAGRMAAGLENLTAEQRKDVYRRLHITATVEDGTVSVAGWSDANYLPEPANPEEWRSIEDEWYVLHRATNGSP